MLKTKEIKRLLQIREGDFVLDEGIYKEILQLKIDGENAIINVEGYEFVINKDELSTFQFATIEDYNDDIRQDVVYSCKHCNQSIGFETVKSAKAHVNQCLFNEANKKCVMCKNLKIKMFPPYPRFANNFVTEDCYHAFQGYNKPYCMKKEIDLTEEEIFGNNDECFEVSFDTPEIERTKDYEEWVELSLSVDEDSLEA